MEKHLKKEVPKLQKIPMRKQKTLPKIRLTSKGAVRIAEQIGNLIYSASDTKANTEKLERFLKALKNLGKLNLIGKVLYSEAGTENNNLLHYASSRGKFYFAETLIIYAKKYLINKKNSLGNTPLMNAVVSDNFNIFQMLAENGADIKSKNNQGEDALSLTITDNKLKFAGLLLKYKAKVSMEAMALARKNQKMLTLLKKKK